MDPTSSDDHRFHIKIGRTAASLARKHGPLVAHAIPDDGYAIDGRQLDDRTFLVAQIRFAWHLQRAEFRTAAITRQTPELTNHHSARRMSDILKPGEAWDLASRESRPVIGKPALHS